MLMHGHVATRGKGQCANPSLAVRTGRKDAAVNLDGIDARYLCVVEVCTVHVHRSEMQRVTAAQAVMSSGIASLAMPFAYR
jgi:hypothetical protein